MTPGAPEGWPEMDALPRLARPEELPRLMDDETLARPLTGPEPIFNWEKNDESCKLCLYASSTTDVNLHMRPVQL